MKAMTAHRAGDDFPASSPARTRRSSAVVRADLLRAAREVFAERGYAGARTRQVAERAHATEQMLYRHFRTKEELFEQAVFQPFSQVVAEFLTEYEARSERGLTAEELTRDYVTGLYRFLRANRENLLALMALRAHPHAGLPSTSPLEQLFSVLERTLVKGLRNRGVEPGDAGLTVRLTFGMVLSAAVMDEGLLGVDADRETTRLLDELTAYVHAGVLHRTRRPAT